MTQVQQLLTDHIDLWTGSIEQKSSAGRGGIGKQNLYGIKKLRELILELAVRGKLVPQDPNDEPASELLKRIAAERDRMVKAGEIKKPKKLPEISEEEKPFELPEGWEWSRLGDLVEVLDALRKPISKADREEGPYPYYGASGIVDFVSDYIFNEPLILVGEDGAKWGTGDYTAFMVSGKIWVNNHAHVLRAINAEANDNFLVTALAQQDLRQYITGITVPKLNQAKLISIVLPLPPQAEQYRIVAKVDELMALCDQLEQQTEQQLDAHQTLVDTLLGTLTQSQNAEELADNWTRLSQHFDTLFTTEASIDQLKQTILQLAVMGKLVPQNPDDEPASVLLQRIAAEKARLIKEKKIKKQKPLPPITDEEKPFELPEGWEWCNLQDLISQMDAGWSPACPSEASPTEDKWGVLKTTAVQTFEYRQDENKVLPDTKEPRPQYEVQAGDILITRAGPKNRVGISCLVTETRPKLMISDKIIRFHLVAAGMSEPYISLCLNAGATAEYLEASKSGMAESQMNISQDKLKAAPIPLAPKQTQHRIITKVNELFTLCDQLKQHLQQQQHTRLLFTDTLVQEALN